ncbi:hypothetical protein [Micromonospora sp. NPDC050200]|uniref:hypothetical protein n=1 Tax=Micromonospora sp. NPDC050200 TaxID=3155664 RepID=UPI003401BC1E
MTRYLGSSIDPMDGLPAGPVVLLRYLPGGGKPCWYVPGGTFRPTVVSLAPQQVIDSISLVPGSTCLAVPVATREGPSKPG